MTRESKHADEMSTDFEIVNENEEECGRCEGWHDPELPCAPLSAEAEDRLTYDRRA